MRNTVLAAFVLGVATPSLAAQAPAPAAPAPQVEAAVDPARLAAAERMIEAMMPPGTLQRVFASDMFPLDPLMGMNAGSLGIPGVEAGASLGESIAAEDPHFRERMRIEGEIMREAMATLVSEMEPDMRRIFARFFARRFDLAELEEMTRFFITPTGRKYVEASFTMMNDPVMTELVAAMMPRMMETFPRVEERISAATAHLPRPAAAEPSDDEE
jgi:hypothetical protein